MFNTRHVSIHTCFIHTFQYAIDVLFNNKNASLCDQQFALSAQIVLSTNSSVIDIFFERLLCHGQIMTTIRT